MAGLRSSRQTLTPNSYWDKDLWPLIPAEQFSPAQIIAINVKSVKEVDERSTSFFCEVRSSAADAACFREDSALFVRSGPFRHFLGPANAELVSGGPFPCSFEGTRYQKRPPTVRNTYSVPKKASWGTRRIFKGPQNHSMKSSASEEEPFMVTSPLSYNIFSAMAAQASASARA